MKQDICAHCRQPFSRYRNRKNQDYCSKKECQRVRKAKWKREKIEKDAVFKTYNQQTNEDWHAKTPGYWKDYRKRNPEKTERNRILQRVRNQKRKKKAEKKIAKMGTPKVIAKVDVLKSNTHQAFNEFWLVPVIAKVDVLKAHILLIPDKSQRQSDTFF